jgi:hypothetical protein
MHGPLNVRLATNKIVLVQVKKPKCVVSWISLANNIMLYHFIPSGILFRRFFTLWQINEHVACIIAFVWDTSLFSYDNFIVGNVRSAHFLCLSVLESGKLYAAWWIMQCLHHLHCSLGTDPVIKIDVIHQNLLIKHCLEDFSPKNKKWIQLWSYHQ